MRGVRCAADTRSRWSEVLCNVARPSLRSGEHTFEMIRHAACSSRAMHYVTFPFKRAHHECLKLLRPIAARHNLTPARFDLLNTLLVKNGRPSIYPYQVAIAKALRLCRSTICKMVKALEKAGFVKGEPHHYDRRYRFLKLTAYGRRCLLRVLKTLRRREIDRTLRDAFVRNMSISRAKRAAFIYRLVLSVRRFNSALDRYFGPDLYPLPRPDFPWNTPAN
jgi:DNA-binding MarR family transcriptional regulator